MFARHLQAQIIERYKSARSIYLFGPRQSGKTTLAKTSLPDLPYTSLEDPDVLEYASSDPRAFLAQFHTGAIIDEPQRYPELFSYLQGEIDHKQKKFLLTSSQNFLTMESISQSLAGRITILNLFPLTKREIEHRPILDLTQKIAPHNNHTIDNLWPLLLHGGYPELNSDLRLFDYWFTDYVKTYLERDVRRIINVQDLGLFQKFIKLCAGRSGSLLNKAQLGADCGISESNCMRWLSLLEQSGIIMLLPPYHNNFNKRQIKSPKLYFIDTGLVCHLLRINTVEHLITHPLVGAIVETFAITDLYKTLLNQGITPDCYFWRDQHGNEIDLIIEMPNGKLFAIEIKAGQTIVNKMLTPLQKFATLAKTDHSLLLYGGSQPQQRAGIDILPLDAL